MKGTERMKEKEKNKERRKTSRVSLMFLEATHSAVFFAQELSSVRNIRHYFMRFGLVGGIMMSGIDALIFRGKAPWTLRNTHHDHATLRPASER